MRGGCAQAATVVALLVALPALLPATSAGGGLTVLILPQIQGAGPGDTVPIRVEVYRWGLPYDPAELELSAIGPAWTELNKSNLSKGAWSTTFVVDNGSVAGDYVRIFASAVAEDGSIQAEPATYIVGGRQPVWEIRSRILPGAVSSPRPGPGDNVVVQVRTYRDGVVSDGLEPNATVTYYEGAQGVTTALHPTWKSAGTWRFEFQVPDDLVRSRRYFVSASLPGAATAPLASVEAVAHPFDFVLSAHANASEVTVDAWAWDDSGPLATAGVRATPTASNVSAETAITDASGHATARAGFDALPWMKSLAVTVRIAAGERSVDELLTIETSPPESLSWGPARNSDRGCSAASQLDLSDVHRGDTATLRLRVTDNGLLVAGVEVAFFLWRAGDPAVLVAGPATTAPDGNLTFEYRVPDDWNYGDYLHGRIVCPSGVHAVLGFEFAPFPVEAGGAVSVDAVGEPLGEVRITAHNIPPAAAGFDYGWAWVVPQLDPEAARAGAWGGTLGCPLTGPMNGESMECTVHLPDALPDGPYAAVVQVSSVGTASNLTREAALANATGFEWERFVLPPRGGPPPALDFTAGAFALLLAGLLAAALRRRSA
ncbi:MAG TPA: hypothetical protein VGB42_12350 [Candidatus Thermoplasmatota archaeon]